MKRMLICLYCLAALLAGIQLSWADYKIGPNDIIRIKVYDHDDLSGDLRVSAGGEIPFPLLGTVQVANLSTAEAGDRIARLMDEQGFLHKPQISVTVLEYHSQEVAVLGFVNKPGRFALEAEVTVADLIAIAGGINPQGDDRAIITREKDGHPERLEMDLKSLLEEGVIPDDVPIARDGDVIYIPRAPIFYIYGEVQRPGSYRLEREMTIAQAISVGGGITPRGSENRVKVQRNVNGQHQEVDVGLTDVLKKDDVVYVGERWF